MQARTSSHYLGLVLESPDPQALARFYQRLLGWELKRDEPEWATLHPGDGTTYLGFHVARPSPPRQLPGVRPPRVARWYSKG